MNERRPKNPSANEEISVAFLGVGRMGETHLRNLATIQGVRVKVVADPNLEAAERGRKLCGAEKAIVSTDEAIQHPGIDAVVIVTPTETHARLIEAAVLAGKAVFTEKPIALDLGETKRVVDLIQRQKAFVQLGFMRRFDPGYSEAKNRIEQGELGRIETFRALSRDTYPPPLKFLLQSGGLFLDMAVHDLDLARFLVGEVEEVQAWATVLIDDRFTQAQDGDTAVTLLRFANGALGVVETSRRSKWGYDIRTEIAGADAKIVIEAPQKTPVTLSREFGGHFDHYENFPDRFEVAYRLELHAFFDALRSGREPSPGAQDALETLRLAIATTRSWKENRSVKIAEIR
ncbi:MAG: inositol 2-dehydrogenase [Verrucomicrobia bacterium]|nr:inositol 2-dehydrogenase [Verrucomicrobiota bacterium]MBV9274695.1 inositol 2-dehydrogenase [Verrucomicrobiota bacterium]